MASGLRIDKIYIRINILLYLKKYDEVIISLYKLFYNNEYDITNMVEIVSNGNIPMVDIDLRDIKVKIYLALEISRVSWLAGHTELSIKWFEFLYELIKEMSFNKLPKNFKRKLIKTINKTNSSALINKFDNIMFSSEK